MSIIIKISLQYLYIQIETLKLLQFKRNYD